MSLPVISSTHLRKAMTEAAQHTPGPWVQFADSVSGRTLAILPAMRRGEVCEFAKAPEDADARLIAAAPDLLAALKSVREACLYAEDDGQIGVTLEPSLYGEQFDAICAAINRAEGRAA